MLRALRQHSLLTATTEVLADAARYVAIMLVMLLLLAGARGQGAGAADPGLHFEGLLILIKGRVAAIAAFPARARDHELQGICP